MRYDNHPDWRLVQLFLARDETNPRTYEVYICVADNELACSCPGYRLRYRCRHVDLVAHNYVQGKLFSLMGRKRDTPPPREAVEDPVLFRRWILENTEVLMLNKEN